MIIKKECINIYKNIGTVYFEFEQAVECPRCHNGASQEIIPVIYHRKKAWYATVLNFCTRCQWCFITTYQIALEDEYSNIFVPVKQLSSEPIVPDTITFSPQITQVSPKFIEIYNQAHQAEIYSLNDITGMGYRKALEFLIKDYAIHFNQTKEDSIKNQSLAQCINTYIDNPKIKDLAEKSTWLGNDETHYVRKHPNYDINDLKRFIDTCVNYIDMELNLKEARSIQKK